MSRVRISGEPPLQWRVGQVVKTPPFHGGFMLSLIHIFILQRFRKNLRWALEKSSFYKKKYNGLDIHAEDIKTLSDIRNLPVTTRDELIQASAFDLLTGPLSQTLRFNRTISGLYRGFTADDIARNIDIAIRPLASNDINKTSTLIICGNYSSQYLLDLHYAAEALGATVLPCNSVRCV